MGKCMRSRRSSTLETKKTKMRGASGVAHGTALAASVPARPKSHRCGALRHPLSSFFSHGPSRGTMPSERRVHTTSYLSCTRGKQVCTCTCSAIADGQSNAEGGKNLPTDSVSVIFLAGGVGKRMGAQIPKQYIHLGGKEIALYSFEVFASMEYVHELVVVCEEEYENVFKSVSIDKPLKFARPGKERQDSCFNGFSKARPGASLVAIHDAYQYGAAVLGVPVKSTIKEVNTDQLVVRTPDRATLWEVQTPQCIKPELLRKGFEKVKAENLEVTDDVSIIEQLGEPVRITTGDYYNIKLTTPEDLQLAESVLSS